MARQDLGALWDAWRTRSDEESLLVLLDEVGPELLRAAKRYTRDESSAHDLVQDTWQAALSKAHAYDATQPLVPWLVGFLLVESKRERRRSARGIDPNRLPPEREEPAPDHHASVDEQRHIVRSAVASLPDLYREVVELTFERGLEPAQIALQLDRAPGTVRVQLHRGLAKLRAALPAGLSLGLAVTLLGGTSEAALRATLIDAALQSADEVMRAAPVATATGAAWKIAAAVALVAIAGGGVFWALSRKDAGSGRELALAPRVQKTAESASEPLADPSAVSTPRAEASTVPLGKAPVVAVANGVFLVASVTGFEPPSATTSGDVRFAVTLQPVDVKIAPRREDLQGAARFEVDVSEWYAAGGPRPREFFCVVDTPRCMPFRASVWLDDQRIEAAGRASARTERVEIPTRIDLVPAACIVTGKALLAPLASRGSGTAVAHAALLRVGPDGNPVAEPEEAVGASDDGRFRIRATRSGAHILAILRPHARPVTLALDLQAGVEKDVGAVELEPGASLAGTVIDSERAPKPGVQVYAKLRSSERVRSLHGNPVVWMNGRFELPGNEVSADDHGLFFVDSLAPSAYELRVDGSRPRDGARHSLALDDWDAEAPSMEAPLVVTAPASGIELRSSIATLLLRVTAQGRPLADAKVAHLGARNRVSVNADAQGLITLFASQPMTASLRVSKLGYLPATIAITPDHFAAAETLVVDLPLGPAPSRVTFDAGSTALDSAIVQMWALDGIDPQAAERLAASERPAGAAWSILTTLEATGRMKDQIPPGRYRGVIHDSQRAHGIATFRPTWFDIDVPPGMEYRFHIALPEGGRFRVPPPTYAGAATRLSVTLTDASGVDVPVEFASTMMRTDARAGQMRGSKLIVAASNLSNALEPGTYTLRVSAQDAEPFTAKVVIEAGKTVEQPVVLESK